jgi:hypothetical protein
MMTTFNLSKVWYVQVKMLEFLFEVNELWARLGNLERGYSRGVFTWKTNAFTR